MASAAFPRHAPRRGGCATLGLPDFGARDCDAASELASRGFAARVALVGCVRVSDSACFFPSRVCRSAARMNEPGDERCGRSRSGELAPTRARRPRPFRPPRRRIQSDSSPTKGDRIRLEEVARSNKGLFSAARVRQDSLHIHFISLGSIDAESQRLDCGDRSSQQEPEG